MDHICNGPHMQWTAYAMDRICNGPRPLLHVQHVHAHVLTDPNTRISEYMHIQGARAGLASALLAVVRHQPPVDRRLPRAPERPLTPTLAPNPNLLPLTPNP